jgi:UDPglucose--hexose-1-phosphate uridylyltransferase
MAGASIPHLHSQLVGVPFVPPRIEAEAAAFARAAQCPLCDLSAHAVIAQTENYRCIAPDGARFAHQQWIVPRAHEPAMREPRELATLVQASARAMREISDACNWSFINFPAEPRAHWYLELIPRTAMIAGFELGTGTFVNASDSRTPAARDAGEDRRTER